MARTKQASKRKSGKIIFPVLGAAGASLAVGGASASVEPTANLSCKAPANSDLTLIEEEISDVSLATFYVLDRENALSPSFGTKVAQRGGRCGGCRGGAGARGGGGRGAVARCGGGGRCAVARCGGAGRCAVARCGGRCAAVARCGCARCGVWRCARCGCSCTGSAAPCWIWGFPAWIYIC